jgi:putative radical SAM enzyme (TIGR03279 family)
MMLNNRFAGEALKRVKRFYDAHIMMNGQIVLCKGINDGEELERSIRDLYEYLPFLESVSVVPVGLSRFREGLYPLEPFTKEDAKEVLTRIHRWQKKAVEEYGLHFIHASDEWYLLAGEPLPQEDNYDGYLQLENGVGMLRLFMDEFDDGLSNLAEEQKGQPLQHREELSILTGRLSYPCIQEMADRLMAVTEGLKIHVYAIRNDFFGENITVSGLLTGTDIIAQGREFVLGERVLLPENVLRSGETVLLDDYTLEDLQTALQVPIDVVKSSGYDFINVILKRNVE